MLRKLFIHCVYDFPRLSDGNGLFIAVVFSIENATYIYKRVVEISLEGFFKLGSLEPAFCFT